MVGMSIEIDANIRKQVEAILAEHGLINGEPEMTREQALEILFAELEKGRKSGLSPLSHEEVWANLKAKCK